MSTFPPPGELPSDATPPSRPPDGWEPAVPLDVASRDEPPAHEPPPASKTSGGVAWGAAAGVGIGAGIAFGVALENAVAGLALGVGLGIALALAFAAGRSRG